MIRTVLLILLSTAIIWAQSFTFGISSIMSPDKGLATYEALGRYVSSQMDLDVSFIQDPDYQTMNEHIERGMVDLAAICSGALVELNPDLLRSILAPVVDGSRSYHSFIVVQCDAGLNELSQLGGKRFAFTDPLSNSGFTYPIYWMGLQGHLPSIFFSQTFFTRSHDRSIAMVHNGIVEAAAVDSHVFDFMKGEKDPLVEDLCIIHRSPPFLAPPLVITNEVPLATSFKMAEVLLDMHLDQEGLPILRRLNVERFVRVTFDEYQPIAEMKDFIRDREP